MTWLIDGVILGVLIVSCGNYLYASYRIMFNLDGENPSKRAGNQHTATISLLMFILMSVVLQMRVIRADIKELRASAEIEKESTDGRQ